LHRRLPIEAGQLLPPAEGAVLQPFVKPEIRTESPPRCCRGITCRQIAPGRVTPVATAFRPDGALSPPTFRSERIAPWPSRWGPYDGHRNPARPTPPSRSFRSAPGEAGSSRLESAAAAFSPGPCPPPALRRGRSDPQPEARRDHR